ncbi:nucleotidyltransferase domain-containing protein [Endozoicomonas gorgoniicola]|uniref:Nucleotidyltransferase domain-containing protein n=1 Tax=Endozoicomonas gorgoniicola TaxID=1234144 RepID=A0ABT3MVM4_9GAMM|nr:nucleotidyltransferase domain-containing protein [Endozoicomonas gorgoniicola]MCW7553153.1 nucleotidyltransferase domain-containing protein [Endozoicomonas gorgoniicola]
MRLTLIQVNVIKQCLTTCFGANTEIWLFGSRVDSEKRGGDIDLYLETDLQEPETLVDCRLKALAAIKTKLGDQKIDLVIHRRGQPREPIHVEALSTGILL